MDDDGLWQPVPQQTCPDTMPVHMHTHIAKAVSVGVAMVVRYGRWLWSSFVMVGRHGRRWLLSFVMVVGYGRWLWSSLVVVGRHGRRWLWSFVMVVGYGR